MRSRVEPARSVAGVAVTPAETASGQQGGSSTSRTATLGDPAEPATGRGSDLIRLRRDSPLRPSDWRARLAAAIIRHPDRRLVEKLNTWADARVKELVAIDRRPVDRRHPVAEARALLEPHRRAVRVEVEARLLAGQPAPEIAEATGVGADAVRWHHDAQYHCGDRLHARGYVVHTFLGSVPPTGDPDDPPIEWARWFGYFGGVTQLEPVLDALRYWQEDRRPQRGGTAAELARRARRLSARAAVLAHSLAVEALSGTGLRTMMTLATRPIRGASGRGG